MKKIFMLLFPVFTAQVLLAQSGSRLSVPGEHRQVVAGLLQQQAESDRLMRATSGVPAERVIAQSTRDNTTTALTDSVNLNYAPDMGSTYDLNTMIYPYNYPYATSPMFNFAGVFTKPQVLFDTCIHWATNPFTLVYGLYESTYANYDTNRNLTGFREVFTDSVTSANMSYINGFNAANDIDSGYSFIVHSGITDSAFSQFFTYNTAGRLSEDSTYEYHLGAWHLVARTKYSYDVSNNLIQIDYYANTTDTTFTLPLIEQEQYVNTYDVSNRLLSVLTKMYSGTALDSYVVDTFGYSGAYTYHNSWKEYQYDPINTYWAPMFYMHKAINGGGLPDTVSTDGFDSLLNAWIPQTMDIVSYNSYNLPDTLWEYDYNFTSFPSTPDFTTVYYYETYTSTVAANNIAAPTGNIKIYPNPATDAITISCNGMMQKGMVTVSLMNVSGQMVSRQKIRSQNEMQVSLHDLLPGVYVVVIQNETGNTLHKQAIVKQ